MNTSTASGSFEHIALAAIRPSTTNPRKNFDQAALAELADSIRAIGVTNPILVRHEVDFTGELMSTNLFEIVTGERRWRAAALAGLAEIPAIVRELDDAAAAELQMVENLQRADLHPVEEAEGYRALLAPGTLSVADVARVTGKAAAHVARMLRLLSLELPIKTLFHAGHLSLDHALLLARLTPADQGRALKQLLNANHLPAKEDMQAYVERRIREHVEYGHDFRMVRDTVTQETAIRAEIVSAVRRAGTTFPNDVLRYSVTLLLTTEGLYRDTGRTVVENVLKLPVKIRPSWPGIKDAIEALTKHIAKSAPGELSGIALEILIADASAIRGWYDLDERDLKESRRSLWDLAKALQVDADKIAQEKTAELDAEAKAAQATAAKEQKASEKKKHDARSKAAVKAAATKKAAKSKQAVARWDAAKARAVQQAAPRPADHKSLAAGDGGAA